MTTPEMEEVVERVERYCEGWTREGAEQASAVTLYRVADMVALLSERRKMVEALDWYGEQARLARLVHSEGDKGRHALASDGGAKARAALTGSREQ